MARLYHLSQAQVDEQELWVTATMLDPDGAEPVEEGVDRMMTPDEFAAESQRMLVERVRAAGAAGAAGAAPTMTGDT